MNPVQEFQRHITRRELLQGSLAGAGGAALAGLLGKDLSAEEGSAAQQELRPPVLISGS
ncbi:MAG: twin-arginine translocation signal domain-containing protein [Planctomycetaceae bacterium]|nr:twin-arginine translocation signal domain-containing protein [Planctomycetaceae bacterium]